MRRSWLLFVMMMTVVVLPACKGNCRQLSEKLCDCAENSALRDRCKRDAAAAEGVNPPTADDEAFCKAKLDSCDCRLVDTEAGKIACGLARE